MKKLCAAALAVLMLISVMPVAVFADNTLGPFTFDGIENVTDITNFSAASVTQSFGKVFGKETNSLKMTGSSAGSSFIRYSTGSAIMPVTTSPQTYRLTSFDVAFENTTDTMELTYSTTANGSVSSGTEVFKYDGSAMQPWGGTGKGSKTGIEAGKWYHIDLVESEDTSYKVDVWVDGVKISTSNQTSSNANRKFGTNLQSILFTVTTAGTSFYLDNFKMELYTKEPMIVAPTFTTEYTVTDKNIEIYKEDTVGKVVSEIKNLDTGYTAKVINASGEVLDENVLAVGNYLSIETDNSQYRCYLYGTKTRLDVTEMSGLIAVTSDSQTVTAEPVFTNKMGSVQNVCLVLSVIKEDAVNGDVLKNTVIKNCTVDTDGTIKENGGTITSISVTADTGDTVEFYALNTLDMTQPAKLVISKIYSNKNQE